MNVNGHSQTCMLDHTGERSLAVASILAAATRATAHYLRPKLFCADIYEPGMGWGRRAGIPRGMSALWLRENLTPIFPMYKEDKGLGDL